MSEVKKYEWSDRFDFDRDLVGYGEKSFNPQWPNNAKIAVSFVLNYEEGGERSVLNGDSEQENSLTECEFPLRKESRGLMIESDYNYGSRAGVWRVFRLFNERNLKLTMYVTGKAYERNPAVAKSATEHGHDNASHCYRWLDFHDMPAEEEKNMIRANIECITKMCGESPKGWYYGRLSPRSKALVWEVHQEMGVPLLWMSDSYEDDVPYWVDVPGERGKSNPKGMLIVPYSLDCNDYQIQEAHKLTPEQWYEQNKGAFDTLYEEGLKGSPKMMTTALHCRIIGKPGRTWALKKFLDYIQSKEGVWIATRTEIAQHFASKFPYKPGQLA